MAWAYRTPYLALFGLLCCAGWVWVLLLVVSHRWGGDRGLWWGLEAAVKVVLAAGLLESTYSLVGLTDNAAGPPLLLVRLFLLWAVASPSPAVQESRFLALACVCWGVQEVPRLLLDCLDLLASAPYALFWLRHSLFVTVHPLSVMGEAGCVFAAAVACMGEGGLGGLSSLPLASLAYLSLLLLVSALYVPTVPSTYVNMHRMRRKQLHIYKKQNTRRAEAQKYRSSGVRKTE
ncbi:tyrosine phosphatase-like protein [Ochromonadaceae sp. CCMP2298]|nr:tyrosine phosphatase-like protein [Ochromonadaceae sp. CCMP2298]|mmetsp:Transcript_11331/g.25210  ORF Transcript_11331/g.25210 Transcript_11331/m.25210 type:complete len:233 (+) Transcript_11331:163-861(+)|eukprot:CAMPEP_0173198074 /NCGR_PEP_ID=MMETSP1141-20130122/16497_1 /TAXON_ID=483371 /ORGANISM="non described non described, Strain CCMP2298" /LENGTH=232 /DNA_ID=CAMNT_0014122851 /DNA_START=112 /DNA_END=810 /DNA_ORIENTATION=+